MAEYDKLHTGELYLPGDKEIVEVQKIAMEKLDRFNLLGPFEEEKRQELLREMFHAFGEDSYIEPPLHANFGGKFVSFGKHVYANSNLTMVDDTKITVGDYTMFGPNVVLATAGHPLDPSLREKAYQFNMPITIGRNCWIGSNVLVMPGVSIGDNSVIGAGSIVTKDIPANVLAYGSPCRVVRELGEEDKEYYYKDKQIPEEIWEQVEELDQTEE